MLLNLPKQFVWHKFRKNINIGSLMQSFMLTQNPLKKLPKNRKSESRNVLKNEKWFKKLFFLSLFSYFFLLEHFCATFSIFLNACTLILGVKRNNLDIAWLRKVKTKYFKTFLQCLLCLSWISWIGYMYNVHVCMTYKKSCRIFFFISYSKFISSYFHMTAYIFSLFTFDYLWG